MYKRIFVILIVVGVLFSFGLLVVFFHGTRFQTETQTLPNQRQYAIHVPSGYNGITKLPIIVALHGYNSSPLFLELNSQLSRLAEKDGYIVVYPHGIVNTNSWRRSWNASYCCGTAAASRRNDIDFVKEVLTHVTKNFAADSQQVFLVGFSNGGLLTHQLATHDSNLFRAAAIISGSIGEKTDPNSEVTVPHTVKPIPMLLIHGEDDQAIPYAGGHSQVHSINFFSFNETMRYWTIRNGCALSPEEISKNDQYTYYKYAFCIENATVKAYSIKDRGHIWPGSIVDRLTHPFGNSFAATETILDFFNEIK
jgi:polyhydroxybutyrate depolymerase